MFIIFFLRLPPIGGIEGALLYLPLEDTARLSFAELGENLEACGADGLEIDAVVAVFQHSVGTVFFHFLPLALVIFVIERPGFGCAEVAVVMVEVEPIDLYVADLVLFVELIADSFGSTLLQPPVVVGLGDVRRALGLPLVIHAACPGVGRCCLRGIVLDRPAIAERLSLRGDGL